MKYPISDYVVNSARDYAEKSLNHTYAWSGFENDSNNQRFKRIVTGKIAEYWLEEKCKEMDINYIMDDTHYTQNDKLDININGWSIHCKAANNLKYSCQVQPEHDVKNRKDTRHNYYLFFYIDGIRTIMPLGFMECEWLIESADKIVKGEKIRGVVTQKHDYSYFIKKSDSLIDFDYHMTFMKNNKPVFLS